MIKLANINDPKVRERVRQQLAREDAARHQQREAPVPAPNKFIKGDRLSGKTLCEVFLNERIARYIPGEDKLNKTEKAYLNHLLCLNVLCLHVQEITLKLADDCRLTPDFSYRDEMGKLVFVDVKGFQREDALIKMKVAARRFPDFKFQIVSRKGIGWKVREVKP